MADYVKKLLEKDPLRLEGYTAYITCISKTVSERELQKFKETITQVKKCCKELQKAQEEEKNAKDAPKTSKKSSINKILDNEGNIRAPYNDNVNEGILNRIKAVQRTLLKPEIKEIVLTVAGNILQDQIKPALQNIEDQFNINPFIQGFKGLITPTIKDNLKELQRTIIAPIMSYYKSEGIIPLNSLNSFKIIKGLVPVAVAIAKGGTRESPFAIGKAIEFVIDRVSPERVYNDLINNKIPIAYGTLLKKAESLEISTPYGGFRNNTFETEVNNDKITAKLLENGSVITF